MEWQKKVNKNVESLLNWKLSKSESEFYSWHESLGDDYCIAQRFA